MASRNRVIGVLFAALSAVFSILFVLDGTSASQPIQAPLGIPAPRDYLSLITSQSYLDELSRSVYDNIRTSGVARYSSGIITATGRHLERNGVLFEARGMNYYPKDYAWDHFWISYTTAIAQIDAELALARGLGVNAVRVFVPYNRFDGADHTRLDHLKDLVDRLQARDMVAIVTLFDLYTSVTNTHPYSTIDYITNTRHISSVVNTLGITNTTILAWDIKNEPDRDYAVHGEDEVKDWLREMVSYTRKLDPNHLVTIGFYGAVTGTPCYTDTPGLVYSPTIAAELSQTVDFVSLHYFLPEHCFASDLQALQSQIGEKPVVLEEYGLHTMDSGANPHTETEQAAYYNALLSLGEAHGVAGYLFWTLSDFSYILPGSEETHHCQGILRNSLVNTCQVTTTLDYTEKPAAETIRRHYADYIYYLDLFDSWVDPNTDAPPPGWTDNWKDGGAMLRGYNPGNSLWSRHPGKVAFSKFVTGSTSIPGIASSPPLQDVDVSRYPILAGQVYSYSIRDPVWGSTSTLHIGIKEGAQITRLLTITPGASLPYTFAVDLRQPPLHWTGNRTFHIAFELVPVPPNNGYSASYEFDWIALERAVAADFAAAPRTGVAPLTVVFTNTSAGDYVASLWDFGDGIITPLPSPTHIYTAPGVYTVTLTVSGPGGADTLTRARCITAHAPVHAGFFASPLSGVAPLTVTFTNTSTGDYADNLWSLGDGVTSTQQHPTHTYTAPGAYTVTLTVSGPGGTDTLTRTNYITVNRPAPAGIAVSGPPKGILNQAYTFTATVTSTMGMAILPLTYTWQATGLTMPVTHLGGMSATAVFSWTVAGTQTITVTAMNPGGAVSDTHTIVVNVPLSSVTIAGPTKGLINETYVFTATAMPSTASQPITYTWSPEPDSGQGMPVATFTWAAAGPHTVIVTATNRAGIPVSDTHAIRVYVPLNEISIAGPMKGITNTDYTFTAMITPTTTTEPITYVWRITGQTVPITHPGGGMTDTITVSWGTPGVRVITVTAVNPGSAVSSLHTITIYVPVNSVSITGSMRGIVNQAYVFTATVAPLSATLPITYVWEAAKHGAWITPPSDNLSDATVVTWTEPGAQVITVTVINPGGAVSKTHTITINVPLNSATIAGPTKGHINTAYVFTITTTPTTATSPVIYTWIPQPDSGQETAKVTYTWAASGPQTIVVSAMNPAGIMVSDTHIITINVPLSAVRIDGPTKGCTYIVYTFTAMISPATATEPITYTWTPAPSYASNTATITYSWTVTGPQTITVVATNPAGPVSAWHTIHIYKCMVYLPAIFKDANTQHSRVVPWADYRPSRR